MQESSNSAINSTQRGAKDLKSAETRSRKDVKPTKMKVRALSSPPQVSSLPQMNTSVSSRGRVRKHSHTVRPLLTGNEDDDNASIASGDNTDDDDDDDYYKATQRRHAAHDKEKGDSDASSDDEAINRDRDAYARARKDFSYLSACACCDAEVERDGRINFADDPKLIPFIATTGLPIKMSENMTRLRELTLQIEFDGGGGDFQSTDAELEFAYLTAMEEELDTNGLRKWASCICVRCCAEIGYLKRNKSAKDRLGFNLPTWSLMNETFLGKMPAELACLSMYEVSMVSLINVFGEVVINGRYEKSKESSWSVVNDLSGIITKLPRRPDDSMNAFVKSSKSEGKQFAYNPRKIYNALIWLKKNNVLYKDVELDFPPEWFQVHYNATTQRNPVPRNQNNTAIAVEHCQHTHSLGDMEPPPPFAPEEDVYQFSQMDPPSPLATPYAPSPDARTSRGHSHYNIENTGLNIPPAMASDHIEHLTSIGELEPPPPIASSTVRKDDALLYGDIQPPPPLHARNDSVIDKEIPFTYMGFSSIDEDALNDIDEDEKLKQDDGLYGADKSATDGRQIFSISNGAESLVGRKQQIEEILQNSNPSGGVFVRSNTKQYPKPWNNPNFYESSFITLYPYGRGRHAKNANEKQTDYFKHCLMLGGDRRFQGNYRWIFYCYYVSMMKKIGSVSHTASQHGGSAHGCDENDGVTVQTMIDVIEASKSKTKDLHSLGASKTSANDERNEPAPEISDAFINSVMERLVPFAKSLDGSPPYCKLMRKQMLEIAASVYPKRKGEWLYFFTRSFASFYFPDIYNQLMYEPPQVSSLDKVQAREAEENAREEAKAAASLLTSAQRSALLKKHPAFVVRYYRSNHNAIEKHILRGEHQPLGDIQDWMIKHEFTHLGDPHSHSALLVKNKENDIDEDSDSESERENNSNETEMNREEQLSAQEPPLGLSDLTDACEDAFCALGGSILEPPPGLIFDYQTQYNNTMSVVESIYMFRQSEEGYPEPPSSFYDCDDKICFGHPDYRAEHVFRDIGDAVNDTSLGLPGSDRLSTFDQEKYFSLAVNTMSAKLLPRRPGDFSGLPDDDENRRAQILEDEKDATYGYDKSLFNDNNDPRRQNFNDEWDYRSTTTDEFNWSIVEDALHDWCRNYQLACQMHLCTLTCWKYNRNPKEPGPCRSNAPREVMDTPKIIVMNGKKKRKRARMCVPRNNQWMNTHIKNVLVLAAIGSNCDLQMLANGMMGAIEYCTSYMGKYDAPNLAVMRKAAQRGFTYFSHINDGAISTAEQYKLIAKSLVSSVEISTVQATSFLLGEKTIQVSREVNYVNCLPKSQKSPRLITRMSTLKKMDPQDSAIARADSPSGSYGCRLAYYNFKRQQNALGIRKGKGKSRFTFWLFMSHFNPTLTSKAEIKDVSKYSEPRTFYEIQDNFFLKRKGNWNTSFIIGDFYYKVRKREAVVSVTPFIPVDPSDPKWCFSQFIMHWDGDDLDEKEEFRGYSYDNMPDAYKSLVHQFPPYYNEFIQQTAMSRNLFADIEEQSDVTEARVIDGDLHEDDHAIDYDGPPRGLHSDNEEDGNESEDSCKDNADASSDEEGQFQVPANVTYYDEQSRDQFEKLLQFADSIKLQAENRDNGERFDPQAPIIQSSMPFAVKDKVYTSRNIQPYTNSDEILAQLREETATINEEQMQAIEKAMICITHSPVNHYTDHFWNEDSQKDEFVVDYDYQLRMCMPGQGGTGKSKVIKILTLICKLFYGKTPG